MERGQSGCESSVLFANRNTIPPPHADKERAKTRRKMILTISSVVLILGFIVFVLALAYGSGYRHGFGDGVERCIGDALEREDMAARTRDTGTITYE
jgi:hypothetical protein